MIAVITGASSGIGRDMAKYLAKLGYDIIAVARDQDKLIELKNEIEKEYKIVVDVITIDLSKPENCKKVYEQVKQEKGSIDILINNAGFGLFGEFDKTDLDTEISMIETNIIAVHILTKLFLKDMIEKDNGHILNVGSIAAFMPGPLMCTYYASKSYVLRLTQGIYEELKKKKSNVKISVLCPGPVNTNFNSVANVRFNLKGLSSQYVAKYAIDCMLKNKLVILPSFQIKMAKILAKIAPDKIVAKVCYHMQEKKK